MIYIKFFIDESSARAWMWDNRNNYKSELCFVENGFEVHYKKLIHIYA